MKKLLNIKLINFSTVDLKVYKNFIYVINSNAFDKITLSLRELTLLNTLKRNLQNSLIGNAIGFSQRLFLKGIGFRIEQISDSLLNIKLGYSHDIFLEIPKDIKVFLPKRTIFICVGSNFEKLMQFRFQLQKLRKFDVYKGKGILVRNQVYFLKEGKKKK